LGWYDKFPEFRNHSLWLSGESYAGVYVPYMLWQIDTYNSEPERLRNETINLKGMMVGNGVTNWTYDSDNAMLNMTYHHALFNDELWDKMQSHKCNYEGYPFDIMPSEECQEFHKEWDNLTENIDIYNIFSPVYPDEPPNFDKTKLELKTNGKVVEVIDGHPEMKKEKKPFT